MADKEKEFRDGFGYTEKELRELYRKHHDAFSAQYYEGKLEITQEEFDRQHAEIWDELDRLLIEQGFKQPELPGLIESSQ